MSFSPALAATQLVGVVATNSIAYIDAVFNAFAAGDTVVPLRSDTDDQRLAATGVKNIVKPEHRKGWFSPRYISGSDDRTALISFTSGTEGAAKGVLISFRALNDVVARLIDVSAVDETIREYIGVPVYHSFGFGRCRLLGAVGGKGYLPSTGFDPHEIAALLARGDINSLAAVPSLLRILLEHKNLFSCGEKLRWLEIGSQPMAVEEKHALQQLFPAACIVQHYGLTEASRTTLLSFSGAPREHLGSVGRVYRDTEIRINEAGRICIRGPHLANGLLVNGEVLPLPGADNWFETSDLGAVRDGFLYFEGRADNVINCGGQKVSAELVEDQVRKALSIGNGFAVSRVTDPVYGEAILVAKDSSCTTPLPELGRLVEKIVAEQGVTARGVIRLFECNALPVTDTGKIKRNELREAFNDYQKGQQSTAKALADDAPLEQKLLSQYQRLAGDTVDVQPTDSLLSLGLDSIVAVKLSMSIENLLGEIPNEWRSQTIRELAHMQGGSRADKAPSRPPRPSPSPVKGSTNANPSSIGFWQLVKEDFVTHERDWLSQGFWAVFNHRFGNWRMGLKRKWMRAPMTLLYRFHRRLVQIFCGIKLDYTVALGRRVKLEHFGGMILGARAIGDDVTIRQNTTFGVKDLSQLDAKPTIENGVNIGAGAVIVGDVTIGRFSVIGPNAVVEHNIPPFSVVSAPQAVVHTHQP